MSILERILGTKTERRDDASGSHEVDGGVGWLDRLTNFGNKSSTGLYVSTGNAMTVPAVFAAVEFISGTMAKLPCHIYRDKNGGSERVTGTLSNLLSAAANDELTAFDFRKYLYREALTEGRGLAYIERNAAGNPVNLFPMRADSTTVTIDADLRKWYSYKPPGAKKSVRYAAADVIDIPFALESDQVTHVKPIKKNAEAIGLALAAMKYGASIFEDGGVPPLILQGAFSSLESADNAGHDLKKSIAKARRESRKALTLPVGFEIKQLGFKPEEMQMVEIQRWCVEQIARIYSLPPTFLQDLTNGTHSNTEQQDLHFVKHTLTRWIVQAEQELNLKLIGRGRRSTYVKFNVDGLLRGDYATRMEGNAKAITTGQLTPNEARALENRPELEGGDVLFIQGALMPTKTQAKAKLQSGTTPKQDKGQGGDPNANG